MVFYPPKWVPELAFDPPDTLPVCDFMFDERHGRYSLDRARDPYTCGLSGKSFTAKQQKERVEQLARALAKELQWVVNDRQGQTGKVVGVFSLNTVSRPGG